MNTVSVLGVPFITNDEKWVYNQCVSFLADAEPHMIITAGPEFVMNIRRTPNLLPVLARADFITPDGVGIVIASKWYGQAVAQRITGVELAERLIGYAAERNLRVFLLGASQTSLDQALQKLKNRYPQLYIVGKHGYFTDEQTASVIAEIQAARPHLLLVGLGQPRQEVFISTHKDILGVPLAIGVGGAIDVIGGAVKRAPVLFQRARLEWLYRLIREPRRWRRQLALPRFAWEAWIEAHRSTRSVN